MLPGSLAIDLLRGDEQPRLDASRCARARCRDARCRACVEACPRQAVRFAPLPVVDPSLCAGCRSCEAACRSAALTGGGDALDELVAELGRHEAAVWGCRLRAQAGGHVRGPCVGFFDHEWLLGMAALLPRGVTFNLTACPECSNAAAAERLPRLIADLERLPDYPFPGRLRLARDAQALAFRPHAMSRRDFLARVRRRTSDRLRDGLRRAAGDAAATRYGAKRLPPGREALLRILPDLDPGLARAVGRHSFGIVTCGSSCRSCRVCVRICPTGAVLEPAAVGERPGFKASRCTGCGVCADFCRQQALTLQPAPWSRQREAAPADAPVATPAFTS